MIKSGAKCCRGNKACFSIYCRAGQPPPNTHTCALFIHSSSLIRCNPTVSGVQESGSFKSHKWLMELYFTGHCRSARGRLQPDMISRQSGERCAMLVQRSHGMEREGKKGRDRERERDFFFFHITSHKDQKFMKEWKHIRYPARHLFVSFLMLLFPYFPSIYHLSLSFIWYLLQMFTLRVYTVQYHFFLLLLFPWSILFLGRGNCVTSPLLVVWVYLFLLLWPLCLPGFPASGKVGCSACLTEMSRGSCIYETNGISE